MPVQTLSTTSFPLLSGRFFSRPAVKRFLPFPESVVLALFGKDAEANDLQKAGVAQRGSSIVIPEVLRKIALWMALGPLVLAAF
jgi:hypothetical protein